jgi:presenilin-like A22 family membrane protease
MKHTLKVTLFLLAIFLASQLVGLTIVSKYLNYDATVQTKTVTYNALPLGFDRPQVDATSSFIWIIAGVIIGTLLFLLLVRFQKFHLWKLWFFLAVGLTLTMAFYAFIANQYVALALAVILAVWKIFRPNIFVHNITEIFVYGGLAAIFVPIINLISAFWLLILISIYDMYAVWKSKHMVKMAEFQSTSKVFAGIFIPYNAKEMDIIKPIKEGSLKGKSEGKNAILGGGDIAFPLLFSGVVLNTLVLEGLSLGTAVMQTLIVTLASALALGLLLYFGKKDRFYPAMPFITAGCFIGYVIIFLLFRI